MFVNLVKLKIKIITYKLQFWYKTLTVNVNFANFHYYFILLYFDFFIYIFYNTIHYKLFIYLVSYKKLYRLVFTYIIVILSTKNITILFGSF